MKRHVFVVGVEPRTLEQLKSACLSTPYSLNDFSSLVEAKTAIENSPKPRNAVLVDFDGLKIRNSLLHIFRRGLPDTYIIGISAKYFHPELEESLREHTYACLSKPVDPDELRFFLRSIFEDEDRKGDSLP
jgi:DNA-binding NtrC family response regulator